MGESIGLATPSKSGLHPNAKFSQLDNRAVLDIDNITILSTDLWHGTIKGVTANFIIKTYPATPAYMYQEAVSLWPVNRFYRIKADGTWREWFQYAQK